LHLEPGGGPLQQPGGPRFSGPCSGAAAAPARGHRAGSSGSWSPRGELLVLGSLRPWLVVAGEGGGCSGGRRPRVAARVARGGAGRAAARGGVGVGQQGLYAPLGGLEAGPYLVDQIRIQFEVFRPNTAQLVDTSRIRIHDVSDTYPYLIRIGYAIRHQTAVSV